MGRESLSDFVAKWVRMRERYAANPAEHGIRHARLIKLWTRFGGRCHLCGGRVPHPILDLAGVDADNAPTADHATPQADGGGRGKNLKLAHRWCNTRRGRTPLTRQLRRSIRAEAERQFSQAPAGVASADDHAAITRA